MGCCFPKPVYGNSSPQVIYIQEYVPPMPLAPLPSAPYEPYYLQSYKDIFL